MSEKVLLVFELIGTVAFALSGAAVGIRKQMDLFGVLILGLTTAVGGGVIRDLVLGVTPPVTFREPIYAVVAVVTSVLAFLPPVRKLFRHHHVFYDRVLLMIDSIGLGVFTMVGIRAATDAPFASTAFLMLFVGVVTGVGGGVLRDLMAGEVPHILVKHFYATASVIGALVAIILWPYLGQTLTMIVCSVLIVILRVLAAVFRWSLPKAKE